MVTQENNIFGQSETGKAIRNLNTQVRQSKTQKATCNQRLVRHNYILQYKVLTHKNVSKTK